VRIRRSSIPLKKGSLGPADLQKPWAIGGTVGQSKNGAQKVKAT